MKIKALFLSILMLFLFAGLANAQGAWTNWYGMATPTNSTVSIPNNGPSNCVGEAEQYSEPTSEWDPDYPNANQDGDNEGIMGYTRDCNGNHMTTLVLESTFRSNPYTTSEYINVYTTGLDFNSAFANTYIRVDHLNNTGANDFFVDYYYSASLQAASGGDD